MIIHELQAEQNQNKKPAAAGAQRTGDEDDGTQNQDTKKDPNQDTKKDPKESNWHLPQARAGFEVSWLVHVLGVQAVASPHSSCLADVSFGTTPPHRASMSLPAFVGSHGVQHRLDRVSMLRSCRCGTSWSSRHVWARSPVTWWCDASPGSSQLHSPAFAIRG